MGYIIIVGFVGLCSTIELPSTQLTSGELGGEKEESKAVKLARDKFPTTLAGLLAP